MINHKTEKLFSTKLEKELADFEGRGSRSPRTYVTSKSYLPKVLLGSNPSVERDLQRELLQINNGRMKRQKIWEWNQRHFLMKQIFDQEYNLRFTQSLVKYSNNLESSSALIGNGYNYNSYHQYSPQRSRTVKSGHESPDHNKEKTDKQHENYNNLIDRRKSKATLGLGIFMPPLHPSQRLIEKAKIPNQNLATVQTFRRKSFTVNHQTNNIDSGVIHVVDDRGLSSSSKLKEGVRSMGSLNHIKGDTYIGNFQLSDLPEGTVSPSKLRRENTVTCFPSGQELGASDDEVVKVSRKVSKSVSLPELPAYNPNSNNVEVNEKTKNCNSETLLNDDLDENLQQFNNKDLFLQSEVNKEEVLCEEDVIDDVTRSLPLSIMIKANQNINRKVQKRKNKMIQQCIKERDKDSLADPRWIELNKVLTTTD